MRLKAMHERRVMVPLSCYVTKMPYQVAHTQKLLVIFLKSGESKIKLPPDSRSLEVCFLVSERYIPAVSS